MTFHPFTNLFIVLCIVTVALILPVPAGILLIAAWCGITLLVPARTDARLAVPFLKLILFAAVFLVLIDGVQWRPLAILPDGLAEAADRFRLIALIIVSVLYLGRMVTGEEMYALFLDFRIPPALTLIIFRTLWLVPRFIERMDEVVLAQRLRGMPTGGAFARFRAVLPALTPVSASLLEETYEQAMVITMRGFLEPGKKTHALRLRFAFRDAVAVAVAVLAAAGLIAM